jgi:hypothetical protein
MLQEAAEGMPVVVKMDYSDGYAILGMPKMYTMRMRAVDFTALTPSWRILSIPCTRRDLQGWVIHKALTKRTSEDDFTDNHEILILPTRIQEEAVRGTEIRLTSDQLQLLDYWAPARQIAQVGISIAGDQRQIEYWLPIQLDPIADEPPHLYLTPLNQR